MSKKQFRDFKSAREFVKKLNFKNTSEWNEYCISGNKPEDIPTKPNRVYKNNGWQGMGDWLGTGNVHPQNMEFLDFESSREFVRGLKLKGQLEWREYCKSGDKPEDIPTTPNRIYKNKGWIDWGDWLGTGSVATKNRVFRDFESSREFVRGLKLKGQLEWREYCKSGDKPEDIPTAAQRTYKDKGWIDWGDWLGTGSVHKKEFRDFESSREFVRGLKLKGQLEWREYCKSGDKPEDIPTNPNRIYKNKGWIDWGDWLGTGSIAPKNRVFRDFESSREFVRGLKLKGQLEWYEYRKSGDKPEDIPSSPNNTYKNDGWVSWGDWLGTGNVHPQNMEFLDFESSREFVRGLKLKGQLEWNEYCKSGDKPEDIPTNPNRIYKNKGWIDWGDWLGTGRISGQIKSKQYLPFKEAREETRKLAKQYNIKNWNDWKNAVRKGLIPKNIPSNPNWTYRKKRNKDGKRNN